MKYTNRHNIPQEIINAVHNDNYSRGKATISATGLLQPPRIRLLAQEHYDKLTIDVSDEIWKLLGQSVHTILERANENNEDTITEQRMFAKVNDWTVSGQTDSIDVKSNILKDYKITSVWSIVSALQDGKTDWEQQLNIYAYLYKQNTGKTIDQLNIIAIARDWNKNQYHRSAGDYPPSPITVLDIDLWSDEEQDAYVEERVRLHNHAQMSAEFEEMPPCPDEVRWMKPAVYAVHKGQNKRALKLFADKAEAEIFAGESEDRVLIERPKTYTRCEKNYCRVADFCNQYNKEVKNDS